MAITGCPGWTVSPGLTRTSVTVADSMPSPRTGRRKSIVSSLRSQSKVIMSKVVTSSSEPADVTTLRLSDLMTLLNRPRRRGVGVDTQLRDRLGHCTAVQLVALGEGEEGRGRDVLGVDLEEPP